jgi:transmembrane sensor
MSTLEPTEDIVVDALTREAAQWIERRDFGDWNEEDRAQFDAWLAQSPAHRVAFIRLETSWQRSELLSALQSFRPARAAPAPRRWWAIGWAAAAAAVALAAFGLTGGFDFKKPEFQTYATTIGGRETLALADGSEIELNTDTVLRISNQARGRKAWLDKGEAYFKIKHDAAHPFVVIAGAHRITDLGTKFTVRDEGSSIKVALMEGRARLDAAGKTGPRSVTLTPGDVALATLTSLSVNKKPAEQLKKDVGWEHGILTFDHLALSDAARELNRYNTRKLVIADAAAGRLTIGGTFATNDVDAIANVAHEIFGLHVENQGNNIVISR